MDSISLRYHLDYQNGEYVGADKELFVALTLNSQSNANRIKNEIDWMAYSVPIMANGLALLPTDYIMKQFHFDQDDKKIDFIKGRWRMPSSHYDVGYRMNTEKHCIDFSFSIPKYIYGHSVAQFVDNPHFEKKNRNLWEYSFDDVTKKWYSLLQRVIRDFMYYTFDGIKLSLKQLEIVRLDLAFNQYFENKEQALEVAKLMGDKRVSSLRGTRGRKQYRDEASTIDKHSSGFTSVHRNLYYKVYHKGTEFAKNDAKRLQSMNDRLVKDMRRDGHKIHKKRVKYDVEALQNEADLILRHEIRYVPKNMSYLFRNKVFRRDCEIFNRKKELFKELEAKRVARQKNPNKPDLTKKERDHHSALGKIIRKGNRFFVDTTPDVKRFEQFNDGRHENYYTEAHFSKELFNLMLKKFKTIINDVQVEHFPAWNVMRTRLNNWNREAVSWNNSYKLTSGYHLRSPSDQKKMSTHFKKTYTRKLVRDVYDYVSKHGSIENAFENGCFGKTTMYKYSNVLKDLGYTSTMTTIPIPVDTSFQTYFERINHWGYKNRYQTYFSGMTQRHKEHF